MSIFVHFCHETTGFPRQDGTAEASCTTHRKLPERFRAFVSQQEGGVRASSRCGPGEDADGGPRCLPEFLRQEHH